MEVVNNFGMPIWQGVVCCWDTGTAVQTGANVTISSQFTATMTTQTITAAASTAGYASQGIISIPNVTYLATQGATVPQALVNLGTGPLAFNYGGLSGSTFTAAFGMAASATNGVATTGTTNPTVFNAPAQSGGTAGTASGGPLFSGSAGLQATTTIETDAGRLVTGTTKSSLGSLAANDPLIAGVASPTGDAATTGAVVQPGNPFLMCVGGVGRVNIAGGTVAALALLTTSGANWGAALATGTIGNLLGIALEAQTAKDTNNTIRSIIKIG
jgi:hypothetical protein